LQQRPRDKNRSGCSAHCVASIKSVAAGHERKIISQSWLPAELGIDFQLRRLAGVLQTIRWWRLEECLSTAQPRRILPCLQRNRAVSDDVAGGSEVRHVLPLLFDRPTSRAHHGVRAAAPVSPALPN